MGVFFDASEIFQFAVRIEENGEKFYRDIAERSGPGEIRELFSYLAGEETVHRKTFLGMLGKVEKYEPPETYPGEYFQYLRSYADNLIFSGDTEKQMTCSKDMACVFDFAIRRELDSIMYYMETKNFVKDTQHKVIDRIINEERKHFVRLTEMKNKLAANA